MENQVQHNKCFKQKNQLQEKRQEERGKSALKYRI